MKNLIISTLIILLSTTVSAQKKYTPPVSWQEQLNKTYCSPLFSTPNGVYFDLTNDNASMGANAYLNILDWLTGRVPGLQVYTNRLGTRIPFLRNTPASIFVDEFRTDPSYLSMLPITDIAMIKVIRTPFIGAPGSGGAIAIYTKRGGEEEEEL